MKRRRSFLLALVLVTGAVTAVVAGLAALLRYEPPEYREACRDRATDAVKASEMLTAVTELQQELQSAREDWGATFAVDDLNAFLRDSFERGGTFDGTLAGRIASPRLWTDGDTLTVAARYQMAPVPSMERDWTTTVVSATVRVWVVSKKTNTVAVEVLSLKAGALPVGAQRYLDRLGEAARESNTEVTWYRHDGHPVGLFRFYANQQQPPVLIQSVAAGDGKITVGGKGANALTEPVVP
jgi:hypothetical protein